MDGLPPPVVGAFRVFASLMLAGALFAGISAAIDGLWLVAGVFAVVATLMLLLVLYGVRSNPADDRMD